MSMAPPNQRAKMTAESFKVQAPLLHDLVRLHGRWRPNELALLDHRHGHSWLEVDRVSNRVANGLIALGVERGDSVSILMSNCVEYAEIIYGIWKAGAVVVPLNVAVAPQDLLTMHLDANVKVAFFTTEHYQRLSALLPKIADLKASIIFGSDKINTTLDFEDWISEQVDTSPELIVEDTDPCNIIYSSGTTGRPKGIKHIHRRRIQALYEMALMHRYHYGAVSLTAIGLYSNISWAPLLLSLLVGAPCIIQREFNPEDWVELVKTHRVTHTMMAPIMFQRILQAKNFSPEAVSSLQAVVSGGSPLFEQLKQEVGAKFGCAVIELYGLTEGFITSLQPEQSEGRITSVGQPVCGNDYILLDDSDHQLGWDNVGEICVHSIHMMTEYHNRKDATHEAMYIDENGKTWLRTGDIGRIDTNGFLYITDRKKDMILSGGQNIFPADIESIMVNHPQVSEVAVIGIPDDAWGETPIALVVPRNDDANAEEICAWTNANVGKRQRIKAVHLRTDMPRNPNGKILKRELRKEFLKN